MSATTEDSAAVEPLRIGMIAPPWYHVPPRAYGGTESVVAALVDQLAERGHEVTLVASGEARTKAARQVTVFEEPPSALLGRSPLPEMAAAAEAARAFAALDLDLVHDHTLTGPLLAAGRSIPTVVTVHGSVHRAEGDYLERLGNAVHLVAISTAQRRTRPQLGWIATVHNAIDVGSFPFAPRKDRDVLWLGRFSPDKGAHLAIDAARAAGRRIVLAGKLTEPSEHEYFDAAIAPRLGGDAEYLGEADAELKRELLARAACLLFPIQWDEPFGMVMIEAMACGTPVVATRRGSVPEIVAHGDTGLVVDAFDELPAAIARADSLDPAASRRRALERFDLPVMAAGYERVYRELLEDDLRPSRSTRRAA